MKPQRITPEARLAAGTFCLPRVLARSSPGGRSRTRRFALEFLESRQLLSTTVTEYPTPASVPPQPADVVSPDGKLWFTVFGNAIGMLDPATSPPTIKSYSQGLPAGSGPSRSRWDRMAISGSPSSWGGDRNARSGELEPDHPELRHYSGDARQRPAVRHHNWP